MTFVDPVGDKLEFRVNSASGKIDAFENDQLFASGLTECTRNEATINFASNAGKKYKATAPDEDTARRVIELFKKSRFEVRYVSNLPYQGEIAMSDCRNVSSDTAG